jgi:hypothetical protein
MGWIWLCFKCKTYLGMGLTIVAKAWHGLFLDEIDELWQSFLDTILDMAGSTDISEQCCALTSLNLKTSPELLDSELETEPVGLWLE